jgi:hypothetical protein
VAAPAVAGLPARLPASGQFGWAGDAVAARCLAQGLGQHAQAAHTPAVQLCLPTPAPAPCPRPPAAAQVATRRVKQANKADIPLVDDHVSKIEHIGRETVKKLLDLQVGKRGGLEDGAGRDIRGTPAGAAGGSGSYEGPCVQQRLQVASRRWAVARCPAAPGCCSARPLARARPLAAADRASAPGTRCSRRIDPTRTGTAPPAPPRRPPPTRWAWTCRPRPSSPASPPWASSSSWCSCPSPTRGCARWWVTAARSGESGCRDAALRCC